MSENTKFLRKTVTRESVLFLILFLLGLFLLPVIIYTVGTSIFGEYAGDGFWAFFGLLQGELWNGEAVVWFLVLSPYLIWQLFRLTMRAFRKPA